MLLRMTRRGVTADVRPRIVAPNGRLVAPNVRRFTLRVPADLWDEVVVLASDERRTLTGQIEILLERGLLISKRDSSAA